ncbi:MAG: hypothetical protein JNJ90_20030 [Saprospiraceae bacterium]|jgi:hypothetical protein|nr:hypothetical protein [Saprospiraceae bacterium]
MDSHTPINYESYVQNLSQTMADAVAAAEALAREATADREVAHADQSAMREFINELEHKALYEAEGERAAVRKVVEKEMADMLAKKLRNLGWPEEKIEVLLLL